MPLTALDELRKAAAERNDERYIALADIVDAHQGLWCPEAEEYLFKTLSQKNKNCQSFSIPVRILDSDGEEKLWIQWKCAEMQLRNW